MRDCFFPSLSRNCWEKKGWGTGVLFWLKFCDGCARLWRGWFPEVCRIFSNIWLFDSCSVYKLIVLHVTGHLIVCLTEVKTLVEWGVKNLLTWIFKEGWHGARHFWFAPFQILKLNYTCRWLVPRSVPLGATACWSTTTLKNPLIALNLRFWLRGWRALLNSIQFFDFDSFLGAYLFLDSDGIRVYASLRTCPNWRSLIRETLLSWLRQRSAPRLV